MSNYFEQSPDYIPFSHHDRQFYDTLKALSETSGKLYIDRHGLKVVSKIQLILEKILSIFGRKDHTSIPNVEMGLAKFLYYGYSQGYTRHEEFEGWLTLFKQRVEPIPFSSTMQEMIGLLETHAKQELNETVRMELSIKLKDIRNTYGNKIGAIGGKTRIAKGSLLAFGRTPLALAKQALDRGDLSEAMLQAENAYSLRVPENYDAVGTLFLKIAQKMKFPNYEVDARLSEFRDRALNQNDYKKAFDFDLARDDLPIKDSSILLHFTNIAEKNKDPVAALKYYERAIKNGAQQDTQRLANLHLKVAESFYDNERKRWIPNYSEVIKHYKTAIKLFKEDKKLIQAIFVEENLSWVKHYLEVLKARGNVKEGVKLIEEIADNRSMFCKQKNKILKKNEVERVKTLESDVKNVIKLYELAMKYDPTNGKHPFDLANWQEFLNKKENPANVVVPVELFEKAANLDRNNLHYRVGVAHAYIARDGDFKNAPDWAIAGASQPDYAKIYDFFFGHDNNSDEERFLPTEDS